MFESLFVAAVLGAGGPAPTPAVAPAPRDVPTLTAAYHLRNVAAADAHAAIAAALGTDRGFSVRPAENQFVVTGSPATHARVAALVAELDRAVPQVQLTVLVAEVPESFLTDCGLDTPAGCHFLSGRELALFQTALRHYPKRVVLTRPEVLVADNQTGHVRVGGEVAVGVNQATPVGVTLRLTPRILPDGKVQLRAESQVATPCVSPVALRTGAMAFPISIESLQTIALVPTGTTLVVAASKSWATGKPVVTLVVVTPTVVRP